MSGFDRHDVAYRLRELVGGLEPERIAVAAERLRVEEAALRASADDVSPYPTMDVLVAVVREYGVDPTWLLTGEYVGATHRRAMEEGSPGIRATMDEILRKRVTPPAAPKLGSWFEDESLDA